MNLGELTSSPNVLASHYSRFQVADRLLLTGHSHQAWPDVALDGLTESFTSAARGVDAKWDDALAKADDLRAAVRAWIQDPGADIALGSSTHELLIRLLSGFGILGAKGSGSGRGKIITTDMEFHSATRQLQRLAEDGLEVDVVSAQPVSTLSERIAARCDHHTAAVLVSSVLFTTSQRIPHLDLLATKASKVGAEFIVDAYHHIGPSVFSVADLGLDSAWIVGGGYKYLQWGEGVCWMRLPAHAQQLRPVVTGWYAQFGALSESNESGQVAYGPGGQRFAGSTYDPTSHYRAAAVATFFAEQGLTASFLEQVYRHQVGVLMDAFDGLDLPDSVVTRDRSMATEDLGGFLTLSSPHAAQLQQRLADKEVLTDARGAFLRFGPAPYLTDDQLREAMSILGEVARTV
ncbi:aminotransferase class V-fold PLP-dependent enzyme [Natronoglycomyces albus]|uniref:Aminotransferase class V-fold PLP-dependent enzyme n=1 Tax=Natronoglycomyces albus TaxID=2811108 RepID=A0A895XMB4_9ACTN|nr:aminotransferase class V-fold PLP-dependent enzyme [Natronoglycomyces albus]QSB04135.1 aminotransferase class V-fold PLP-dependent enzyme [Natronoglycomyces albus]